METRLRSVLKAVTWRLASLVMTTAVAWVGTGRLGLAVSIGLADLAVKSLFYYSHERLWVRVKFGRLPPSDFEV